MPSINKLLMYVKNVLLDVTSSKHCPAGQVTVGWLPLLVGVAALALPNPVPRSAQTDTPAIASSTIWGVENLEALFPLAAPNIVFLPFPGLLLFADALSARQSRRVWCGTFALWVRNLGNGIPTIPIVRCSTPAPCLI